MFTSKLLSSPNIFSLTFSNYFLQLRILYKIYHHSFLLSRLALYCLAMIMFEFTSSCFIFSRVSSFSLLSLRSRIFLRRLSTRAYYLLWLRMLLVLRFDCLVFRVSSFVCHVTWDSSVFTRLVSRCLVLVQLSCMRVVWVVVRFSRCSLFEVCF